VLANTYLIVEPQKQSRWCYKHLGHSWPVYVCLLKDTINCFTLPRAETERPRDSTRPICLSRIVFMHVMLGVIKSNCVLRRLLYAVLHFLNSILLRGISTATTSDVKYSCKLSFQAIFRVNPILFYLIDTSCNADNPYRNI